jgi:hypothetical protein
MMFLLRVVFVVAAICCGVACSAQNTATWGYSQYVAPPAVPDTLDFAGERVPLENFDTRESLQREMLVTLYAHGGTQFTLLNMKRYFSIIEPVLAKNNIPADFKYLCVAESSLMPEAMSGAGAAGLWQFMPATGKELGLEVDGEVDERYHIEKATEAACEYFRKAYDRFGSWTLVAAAYNLGTAGVTKRIERQGVENYYDAFLPTETLRYVFRILAWKVLMENPSAYGFYIKDNEYYSPLSDYGEVSVSDSPVEWSAVAKEYGTTYKMLRQLNPWIRDYAYKNSRKQTLKVKIPAEGFRQSTAKEE